VIDPPKGCCLLPFSSRVPRRGESRGPKRCGCSSHSAARLVAAVPPGLSPSRQLFSVLPHITAPVCFSAVRLLPCFFLILWENISFPYFLARAGSKAIRLCKLIFKIAEDASRSERSLFSGGRRECFAVLNLERRQRGAQAGGFPVGPLRLEADRTGQCGLCWNWRSQFPFYPVRSKNTSGVFLAFSF